jgi:hypothetical protein
MNKFVLRFGFLIVSLFITNIAFGQGVMDKIVEDACQKVEEFEINKNTDFKELETELARMFGVVLIPYVDEINTEYGINILEGEGEAEAFGEKVGIELVKKCPKFMEVAMVLASQGEEGELGAIDIFELNGSFLKVEEKGDFVYLTVKDENKRAHKLLWYEHFEGADQFINNPKRLRGKQVTITYKKVEVYSPQIKDYRVVKQLISLEFN